MKALPTPPAPVVGNTLVHRVVYIVFDVSITDDANENLLCSGHGCCYTCKTVDEACEGIKSSSDGGALRKVIEHARPRGGLPYIGG